jgi:hypothetical protein
MLKKFMLLSVFAAIVAGGAWAQSARNWISGGINTGTLFTGGTVVNYEYLLPVANDSFSVTVQGGTRIFVVPTILAGARWYPWGGGSGNPGSKFHVDAEIGYCVGLGLAYEGSLGWKIDTGPANGFFLDISLTAGLPVLAGIEFVAGFAF